MRKVVWLILPVTSCAKAQIIEVDKSVVMRADTLKATMKLSAPVHGEGTLVLKWTDSYGRLVANETRKVRLDGDSVPLSLPLRRAIAMQNFLAVELTAGKERITSNRGT